MAQLLQGRATTAARTRQAIQQSTEPVTVLARRFGVNPKTVRRGRCQRQIAKGCAPWGAWPSGYSSVTALMARPLGATCRPACPDSSTAQIRASARDREVQKWIAWKRDPVKIRARAARRCALPRAS
jgi:hypothetical protein